MMLLVEAHAIVQRHEGSLTPFSSSAHAQGVVRRPMNSNAAVSGAPTKASNPACNSPAVHRRQRAHSGHMGQQMASWPAARAGSTPMLNQLDPGQHEQAAEQRAV